MLFYVKMTVRKPDNIEDNYFGQLQQQEKEYCQKLQKTGKWLYIWRIVGEYKNISIFDVDDNTELHELLVNLPLYNFIEIEITPLCRHPSSV